MKLLIAIVSLGLVGCAHQRPLSCEEQCARRNMRCSGTAFTNGTVTGGIVTPDLKYLPADGSLSAETTICSAEPARRAAVTSAAAKRAYNDVVSMQNTGWYMLSLTYGTTTIVGLATGTVLPAIPVVGPLAQIAQNSANDINSTYNVLNGLSFGLQAAGLYLVLSNQVEPESSTLSGALINGGASCSLSFRF